MTQHSHTNSPPIKASANIKVSIVKVDFANPVQTDTWLALLNSYACDPMGGGTNLSENTQNILPAAMAKQSRAICLLAENTQGQAIGLLNAFEGFSTFAAAPLLNIHDVYIAPDYRGQGVLNELFNALTKEAINRQCCKITLEVLDKNSRAMAAYRRLGFGEYQLDPDAGEAVFWQKKLFD